ncbi:MmcQ/YjbR family DNA-binding protein [Larkinella terrae]|uniref:MmcQ/YjbR family DNA-binding protein n=1 Tax=Larkinella terrae TaxID=2025311 RepID=A0A7K0EL43_9BACT|nr:MmcQ/YjbR family DNA-binding protein [Larkinella terrae]MRS62261.1 MmcQ/YjbR family DNA-binding protein [Larkinella terrae]
MVSNAEFRKLASALPDVVELPHFENTSFRVKKKIFATLAEKHNRACLKFSEVDQSVFSSFDQTVIYPVPNKWGKQGWTFIELAKVEEETLIDALKTAHQQVVNSSKGQPKKSL